MISQNDLLVNTVRFAEIACMDGRVDLTIVPCETCGIEFNPCLRNNLIHLLRADQEQLERCVGYNLTPRYHVEEVYWQGEDKIQLSYPGIAAVNVIEELEMLDADIPVSPFVIEDAPLTLSIDSTYCIVELDGTYIKNPDHAILRDADTNAILKTQTIDEYPVRIDGNWFVALDKPNLAPDCEDLTVNVQHCKYMVVVIPTPVCTGSVKAVYSGTDEVIPFAKDPQVVDGNTIYWFYSWSMVDEDFRDDITNLETGEFWKLVETIDIICSKDEEELSVATYFKPPCNLEDNFVTSTELDITILSSKRGIIHVKNSDICSVCPGKPVKLLIYYRTDPSLLEIQGSFYALEEAIAYLVASELPLEGCSCKIATGFISVAQAAYTDLRINPFTGAERFVFKYGNRHGELIFNQRVEKAYKFRKLISVRSSR